MKSPARLVIRMPSQCIPFDALVTSPLAFSAWLNPFCFHSVSPAALVQAQKVS
jgi:hypothetical protein